MLGLFVGLRARHLRDVSQLAAAERDLLLARYLFPANRTNSREQIAISCEANIGRFERDEPGHPMTLWALGNEICGNQPNSTNLLRPLDAPGGLSVFSAAPFVGQGTIGFRAGDANLYRYVGNNATNEVDPSGLEEGKPVVRLEKITPVYDPKARGKMRNYGGIRLVFENVDVTKIRILQYQQLIICAQTGACNIIDDRYIDFTHAHLGGGGTLRSSTPKAPLWFLDAPAPAKNPFGFLDYDDLAKNPRSATYDDTPTTPDEVFAESKAMQTMLEKKLRAAAARPKDDDRGFSTRITVDVNFRTFVYLEGKPLEMIPWSIHGSASMYLEDKDVVFRASKGGYSDSVKVGKPTTDTLPDYYMKELKREYGDNCMAK